MSRRLRTMPGFRHIKKVRMLLNAAEVSLIQETSRARALMPINSNLLASSAVFVVQIWGSSGRSHLVVNRGCQSATFPVRIRASLLQDMRCYSREALMSSKHGLIIDIDARVKSSQLCGELGSLVAGISHGDILKVKWEAQNNSSVKTCSLF
jgi:hypothetical protein